MSDPLLPGVVNPCPPQASYSSSSSSSSSLPHHIVPSSIPQGLTYVRSTSPSPVQYPTSPTQSLFHGHGRRGTSNDLVPIQGNAGERIYMFTDHSGQIHTFTQSELNDLNDLTAQLASTYGQVPTQSAEPSSNFDNLPLTTDSPTLTSTTSPPSPDPQRTSYPTPESESMGSPDLDSKQMPQAFALSSTSFDNILSTASPVPDGDYSGVLYNEPNGYSPADLFVIPELPKACGERSMSPSSMSMTSTDPRNAVVGVEGESSRVIRQHVPVSPPLIPEEIRGQRTMSKSSQRPLRTTLQGINENLKRMRPSSFDSFKSFFSRPGSYASSHGSMTVVVPPPVPGLPTSPLSMIEGPGSPESNFSGEDTASPGANSPVATSKKSKSAKKIKTEKTEEEKREYNRMKASKSMKGLANDTIEMGEILKQNRDILQYHQIDLPEDVDGGRPMQKPAIVRTAKTALGKLLPRFAVVGGLRAEKENLEANCAQLNRQRDNMMIMVQGLQHQMEKLRIEVEGLNTQKSGLVTDVQDLLFRRETLINEVSVAQQHLQGLNFQITQVSAIRPAGPRGRPRQPLGKSSLEHEVIPDS